MKMRNVLLSGLVLSGLFFASCKKDDSNNDPIKPNENPVTEEYSALTVEQNKANIENNGFELLNAARTMETSLSVRAAANMVQYIQSSFLFEGNTAFNPQGPIKVKTLLKPVFIAAGLDEFNASNVAEELKDMPDSTLVGLYNKAKGIYTWNCKEKKWDYTTSTNNEIRIEFPSTREGKTNNVVFRIFDLLCEKGPFTWMGDYSGELPKQIKMELKVDETVLLSYLFNATFQNTDKKPNSIVTSLTLSQFNLTLEAKNSGNTSGSVSLKWTKDNTVLAMISLDAKGNWNQENIENEDAEIGDYVTEGNITLQLMNIKVIGKADVNTIADKFIADNENKIEKDSLAIAADCDFINNNASLSVCYADNSQIIAKVIAYPSSHYNGYDINGVQIKEYEIGLAFKFKDNSKVNAKTYFGDGFDALVQEAMIYYKDIMRKYRVYDK